MARMEAMGGAQDDADTQQLLAEKDAQMGELRETVEILEVKLSPDAQLAGLLDAFPL